MELKVENDAFKGNFSTDQANILHKSLYNNVTGLDTYRYSKGLLPSQKLAGGVNVNMYSFSHPSKIKKADLIMGKKCFILFVEQNIFHYLGYTYVHIMLYCVTRSINP